MQFMSRRARIARLLASALLVIPSVAYAADQKERQNPDRAAAPQAGGTTAAFGSRAPAGLAAHPDASGKPDIKAIEQAWIEASDRLMKDKVTKPDAVDENFLNHVIWYSATDWKRPYPGENEILMPDSFVKAAETARDDDDGDDQDEKLKKAAAAAEGAHDKH